MPAFRLQRISDPGILKHIEPARLLRFLTPFRSYLEERGFGWPTSDPPQIDYEALSGMLLGADDSLPPAIVRTLLFVDEMSSDDRMDQLLAACARARIALDLGSECTPADVAIQASWQAPAVLERQHAGVYALRQKNFHHFAGIHGKRRRFPALSDETLQHLTDDLDECFEAHKRGREAHVMIFDHGRRVWIVVRRGATFKQEGSTKNRQSSLQFYRPEIYDVLFYDTDSDLLAVHADAKWLRDLYRHCIGVHAFGDPKYFPGREWLTLDPLFLQGPGCCNCADISGLEKISLVEVQRHWFNKLHEIDVKKADDIFAALGDRWYSFMSGGRLTKAVFRVWFTGVEKPRSVTLRPENIAKYDQQSDSEPIGQWLVERGFVKAPRAEARQVGATVLEDA
jgi:hypothetical protein